MLNLFIEAESYSAEPGAATGGGRTDGPGGQDGQDGRDGRDGPRHERQEIKTEEEEALKLGDAAASSSSPPSYMRRPSVDRLIRVRGSGPDDTTRRSSSSQDESYRPTLTQLSIMENVTPGSPAGEARMRDYNYLALVVGVLLILIIILGNVLVCLSVLTERSLKTATNYFIISLAVADLLLAVLVLPLYVYSEFLGGTWTLSTSICDALMTMDVMLCTASILNLCAISVDRYIAVVVPLKYNRNQFSVRQLTLITATWVLSLGVASPVIFGLNQVPGRDPTVCKLEDDHFVVYSSVCSFFVPCPVMLILYYWMFRGLRRWSSRSRSQAHRVGRRGLSSHLASALRRAKDTTGSQEKVVYTVPPISPTSPSIFSMATPCATLLTEENQHRAVMAADSDPMTTQMDSVSDGEATGRWEGSGRRENATKRGRRTSKTSRVSGRERKAMKVLPVVVGVFLACWTPFFTVHVTKVLCRSCDIGPTLISVVTWLGYVNSAVNPIIYTIFNAEFRNVFHRLLCCRT